MQTEHAPRASQTSSAIRPSGLRRLSIAMMATGYVAERFKGSPEGEGATRPGQVLAAFKAAAPHLGYGPRVVHIIDWLFTFTQPQDWIEGSRPIVWPSAALQRDALSIGPSQAKALNRHLVELGLVAMKDSPNGKRYGRRDGKKRIIEAYGFDLSPLFERLEEFRAAAAAGRAERERMRHLRRRCTIARKGLQQILETVTELGLLDAAWRQLDGEGRALARSLQKVELLDEMELGVTSLERRQQKAQERLQMQIADTMPDMQTEVDSDPRGPENRPLIITTNERLNPMDTVMASNKSSAASATAGSSLDPSVPPERTQARAGKVAVPLTDQGTVMRLRAEELAGLAPRLRSYLTTSAPGWPDIVEAATWLRHDLGVSQSLWGEACLAMGRERAAIALAIVSAKPPTHFTGSPGGYFNGMVNKAKAGTLNLERTIWGLRQQGKGLANTRSKPAGSTKFMNS